VQIFQGYQQGEADHREDVRGSERREMGAGPMNVCVIIEDVVAHACLMVCFVGWGISLFELSKLVKIVKEMAPWIETKRMQDGQDAFLASLTPEEQQAVARQHFEAMQDRIMGR
jgi:hypothetical protein